MWVNIFQNYITEQESIEVEIGVSVYIGVISTKSQQCENLIIVTNCFSFFVYHSNIYVAFCSF